MTATLPLYLRKELESAIGQYTSISASTELYNQFDRHRIIVREGLLSDNLDLVQGYLDKNKKVLVV